MSHIIKSSILIFILLAGIIISQDATTTPAAESPVVPTASTSGSGSGSGSGKGSGYGMRGESGKRPDGPSNLPPANGGFSDKIAAITDSKIFIVKNILKYLPLVEQDLLAGMYIYQPKIFFYFSPN